MGLQAALSLRSFHMHPSVPITPSIDHSISDVNNALRFPGTKGSCLAWDGAGFPGLVLGTQLGPLPPFAWGTWETALLAARKPDGPQEPGFC